MESPSGTAQGTSDGKEEGTVQKYVLLRLDRRSLYKFGLRRRRSIVLDPTSTNRGGDGPTESCVSSGPDPFPPLTRVPVSEVGMSPHRRGEVCSPVPYRTTPPRKTPFAGLTGSHWEETPPKT